VSEVYRSPISYIGGLSVDGDGNAVIRDEYTSSIFRVASSAAVAIYPTSLRLSSAWVYDAPIVSASSSAFYYTARPANARNFSIVSVDSRRRHAVVMSGLIRPAALAVDSASNAYVLDCGVMKLFNSSAGAVSVLASGLISHSTASIAVDPAGNIYFAVRASASGAGYAVRKMTTAGVVTTYAGTFSDYARITSDSLGNVYVAEQGTIYMYPSSGGSRTTVGTVGEWTPSGSSGYPASIAVNSVGRVHAFSWANNPLTDSMVRSFNGSNVVSTVSLAQISSRSVYPRSIDDASNLAFNGSDFIFFSAIDAIVSVSPSGVVAREVEGSGVIKCHTSGPSGFFCGNVSHRWYQGQALQQ